MIIVTVVYNIINGWNRLELWLSLIRLGFTFVVCLAFVLSFVAKWLYKGFFHPVVLLGYSLHFLTVALEFYPMNIPFVIFYAVVIFSGLYISGCFLFFSVVFTNIVHIIAVAIFLIAQGEPHTIILQSAFYMIFIMILGGTFLYFLEKSRKEVSIYMFALILTISEFCL